jgi:hypothetical protein
VTDTRGTALVAPGSFEQLLFTAVGGGDELSDHCPIAVVFESDDTIEPSDAIAMLLDRLDAVQAELEEIRAGIAAVAGVVDKPRLGELFIVTALSDDRPSLCGVGSGTRIKLTV